MTLARLMLPVAARLAPRAVEAWAMRAFSTTRRRLTVAAPTGASHAFTLKTRGGALRVWEWGRAGRTVLLVHGWNGHAGQMNDLVAPLLQRGLHVVAFDQPAHGESAGERSNVAEFRDAVLQVAARFAPVEAIVAHSLGATATLMAIASGLPVARAVLLAPPADMAPYLQRFGAAVRLPPARVAGMVAIARGMLGGTTSALESAAKVRDGGAGVLVLADPMDDEVPYAEGRALAERLPAAAFQTVPGVGHRGLLSDRPTVQTIAEFVVHGAAALTSGRHPGSAPRAVHHEAAS